jgi:cytochrome-b5 reductase
VKRIFFIAGGSGITPIFQTIMEIASNKDDNTELILLYANKTEEDIVLRKELETQGNRIKLHYILDNPPNNWPYFKGHINH